MYDFPKIPASTGSSLIVNMIGKQIGYWTVLGLHPERGSGRQARWIVHCRCGTVGIVQGASLRNGDSKSCGCFRHELLVQRNTKHGLSHLRAYTCWKHLVARCCNPDHPEFNDYGGRGIKVCDAWRESFLTFYADMGDPPPKMSLDRINNDGDYEPANCRWTTTLQQARNRRRRAIYRWKERNNRMLLEKWRAA
jgi:hypothetical protein